MLFFSWGVEGTGRRGCKHYQAISGLPRILIGKTQLSTQDAHAVQDRLIIFNIVTCQ